MSYKRMTAEEVEALNRRNAEAWKRSPAHSTAQSLRGSVRPRAPSETAECRTFVEWTKLVTFHGEPLYERVVKIPNERGKAGAMTAILTSIGMRAGFPDYDILAPAGQWHGLYLEAKKIRGGIVSTDQTQWREKLIRYGYYCEICAGSLELIRATQNYFLAAGAVADGTFIDHTRVSA